MLYVIHLNKIVKLPLKAIPKEDTIKHDNTVYLIRFNGEPRAFLNQKDAESMLQALRKRWGFTR